jgi:MFS family permease
VDARATDDAQWSDEEPGPTPDPAATARRRHRDRVGTAVVIGVSLLVAAAILVAGLPDVDVRSPRELTAVVLIFIGLVLVGTGFGTGLLKRRRLGGPRDATLLLDRAQRMDLLDQIRGQRPVDPTRLAVARNLAERLVHQRWLALGFAGLLLSQIGQVLTAPSVSRAWIATGVAVVLGAACVFAAWGARRGQRFLAAHPAHT